MASEPPAPVPAPPAPPAPGPEPADDDRDSPRYCGQNVGADWDDYRYEPLSDESDDYDSDGRFTGGEAGKDPNYVFRNLIDA